ncbi:cytosolic sulfotransferase 15-like [Durio zibethinus]|uniref:Sulfotransferase n=1 Tax=Durio zibethinus TaxID=66656 RepID=A0A6P5YTV6_DURZI|nr:cytosolic sulfotransferase 15-like [Durio zibethinus]
MDATEIAKDINIVPTPQDEDHEVNWEDEFQELMQTLPKEKSWYGRDLYFYQGFWCPFSVFKAVISFQKHFQALDSDIFVTSLPKCGTTWLKALTFSIVNRNQFAMEQSPLLSLGPHQLVRSFEYDLYLNNPCPDLENSCVYQPRLLSTHIPYASLPPSIKDSNSKIVYMCRNPMDTFVSLWFFTDQFRPENVKPSSLDEAFDMLCQQIHAFGPFFDHVLGYWKASQEKPNKILFLQYEDLHENIISHLKKLAMFLGFPFSEEEEKHGVIEEIAKICSFGNLKELDVHKNGTHISGIRPNTLFRKGKPEDWINYLTPAVVERLKKLIQHKLDKSGLTFKLSCKSPEQDYA